MAAFWVGAKLEEVIEIDRPDRLRLRDVLTVFYRVTRRREGRRLDLLDPYTQVGRRAGREGGRERAGWSGRGGEQSRAEQSSSARTERGLWQRCPPGPSSVPTQSLTNTHFPLPLPPPPPALPASGTRR